MRRSSNTFSRAFTITISRALLGALLVLGGCAGQATRVVVPPLPPRPPVVGPVTPTPPPTPPPGPVAPGRALSEADVAAIPLGSSEADLVAAYGAPLRIVPLPQEGGARSYLYRAYLASDSTRLAAFWVRDGKVVNKVLY